MRIAVLLVLATMACVADDYVEVNDRVAIDRAVYRTVLDTLFVPRSSPRKARQLVIRNHTSVFQPEILVEGVVQSLYELPGINKEVVHDFEVNNRETHPLQGLSTPDARIPVVLGADSVLSSLPKSDVDEYWSKFYQLFPGAAGHIAVSSVGYNSKRTVAIVMVDQGCGGLCGNSYTVTLRRHGKKWFITEISQTAVS